MILIMKKEEKIGIYRKNQKGFGFVKIENDEIRKITSSDSEYKSASL